MYLVSFLVPAFLVAKASAHGFLAEIHIGGHQYEGNSVGNPPKDSPIRQLSDIGPNKGASNPNIVCGHGAKRAELVAAAMPGDKMTFDWRDGDGNQHWPHDMGPMLTYMASCGSKACNDFDPTNARWFKIQETGLLSDGTWKQADLKRGDTIHASIPDNLAPGNYLVRSEIISLHNANQKKGAEFYVDCVQTRVDGNKTGTPSEKDLVKFPGAYSDEDPGIWVPNIYDGITNYTIPGPKIATISNEDGESSDSTSDSGDGSAPAGQQNNSSTEPPPVIGSKDDNDRDDSNEGQDDDTDVESDDTSHDQDVQASTHDDGEQDYEEYADNNDSGNGSELGPSQTEQDTAKGCDSGATRTRHNVRRINSRSKSRRQPAERAVPFEAHSPKARFMRLRRNALGY